MGIVTIVRLAIVAAMQQLLAQLHVMHGCAGDRDCPRSN
jgi:hypothetical protein